jgi:flagellar basal body P-ring protein FlgI
MLDLRLKGDFFINHVTSTSSGKTARIHISLDTEDETTLRQILDALAQAKTAQNSTPKPTLIQRSAKFHADLLKTLKQRQF